MHRAWNFLGRGARDESRNNVNKGDDLARVLPAFIAGKQNQDACMRLCELIRDKSQACIVVEGPSLSGKSLCCDLAFRHTGCKVVTWNVRDATYESHVSVDTSVAQKHTEDDFFEVLFVDNLHDLLRDDKNSFQALLKTIRAVHALRHKVDSRVRVVVMVDETKLDNRIKSRLYKPPPSTKKGGVRTHNTGNQQQHPAPVVVLRISHPEPEETAAYVQDVIGAMPPREACRRGVRHAVGSLLPGYHDDNDEENEIKIDLGPAPCDSRHNKGTTTRRCNTSNKGGGSAKNKNTQNTLNVDRKEPVTSDTLNTVLESCTLKFDRPENAATVSTVAAGAEAACLLYAYCESKGTLCIPVWAHVLEASRDCGQRQMSLVSHASHNRKK